MPWDHPPVDPHVQGASSSIVLDARMRIIGARIAERHGLYGLSKSHLIFVFVFLGTREPLSTLLLFNDRKMNEDRGSTAFAAWRPTTWKKVAGSHTAASFMGTAPVRPSTVAARKKFKSESLFASSAVERVLPRQERVSTAQWGLHPPRGTLHVSEPVMRKVSKCMILSKG